MKNFVYVGASYRDLEHTFREYIEEHRKCIEKVKRKPPFEIKLKNGDIITYVSINVYDKWCKGKTYYDETGKIKCHSGLRIK